MHYILVTFEPYIKSGDIRKILSKVRLKSRDSRGIEIVKLWGRRALIRVEDLNTAINKLKYLNAVSRIIPIYSIIEGRSIDDLSSESINVMRKLANINTFKVECRRWDKEYPVKSVDVARYIGARVCSELKLKVDLLNPDVILFIGIDKDKAYIGLYGKELIKLKEAIDKSILKSVRVIVEKVNLEYEMADLIQLSRAIGVEIYIPWSTDIEALYRKVLEKLSLNEKDVNVRIIRDIDWILDSSECIIALTPHAKLNEAFLIDIATQYEGITLLLGSEYEDISYKLRSKADYEVRLGPITDQPMRISNAIAYALGVILPVRAGYI